MNALELTNRTLAAATNAQLQGFNKTTEALVMIAAAMSDVDLKYDSTDPNQVDLMRRSLTPQLLTDS